jgi:hypothetical protein
VASLCDTLPSFLELIYTVFHVEHNIIIYCLAFHRLRHGSENEQVIGWVNDLNIAPIPGAEGVDKVTQKKLSHG